MCLEAPQAHVVVRSLMGATDPVQAAPGTIRGDFGLVIDANVVHGSDSTASAARELGLFFPDLRPAES
jgi:nucleoside-diphosphate kinase